MLCSKHSALLVMKSLLFQMAQKFDADSEKETHSFSGMYSCEAAPRAIILFKPAFESEEIGYFWKLEQISKPRTFFMPEGSRKSFGRITKVLINENSYTKVATPWTVARSAIHHIYDGLYSVHHPESLIESDHCHYLPAEEIEDLVISFVLRYSEDELDDAPLQLNINVCGNELPGDLHEGLKINLRTGNQVMISHEPCVQNEGSDMACFGGLAVLTKNPTGIQVHQINEEFIQYLLREFGNRRLMFFSNCNRQQARVFCDQFDIKEPIRGSCCILM